MFSGQKIKFCLKRFKSGHIKVPNDQQYALALALANFNLQKSNCETGLHSLFLWSCLHSRSSKGNALSFCLLRHYCTFALPLRSRKTNFNSSFFYELICIFPSPVFCETSFCVYCVLFLEYNFALLVCNDVCVNMKGSRGMKGCLACTNNHTYTTLLLEYSSYQHHNYDCSNYYI